MRQKDKILAYIMIAVIVLLMIIMWMGLFKVEAADFKGDGDTYEASSQSTSDVYSGDSSDASSSKTSSHKDNDDDDEDESDTDESFLDSEDAEAFGGILSDFQSYLGDMRGYIDTTMNTESTDKAIKQYKTPKWFGKITFAVDTFGVFVADAALKLLFASLSIVILHGLVAVYSNSYYEKASSWKHPFLLKAVESTRAKYPAGGGQNKNTGGYSNNSYNNQNMYNQNGPNNNNNNNNNGGNFAAGAMNATKNLFSPFQVIVSYAAACLFELASLAVLFILLKYGIGAKFLVLIAQFAITGLLIVVKAFTGFLGSMT